MKRSAINIVQFPISLSLSVSSPFFHFYFNDDDEISCCFHSIWISLGWFNENKIGSRLLNKILFWTFFGLLLNNSDSVVNLHSKMDSNLFQSHCAELHFSKAWFQSYILSTWNTMCFVHRSWHVRCTSIVFSRFN